MISSSGSDYHSQHSINRTYSAITLATGDPGPVSETTPINISRPIFYTGDLYPGGERGVPGDVPFQTNPSTTVIVDMLKQYSKRLIPGDRKRLSCFGFLQTVFPILSWLPKYSLKSDLLADIAAGLTVLALHIPQGLAYGKLAGVQPIYGLYVSLFPVLIYTFFGTSHQVSIGKYNS